MSLYLKYRPQGLSDFVGNRNTIEILESILQKPHNEFPHAFLFAGPSGCGKTTLARIMAKKLGCSDNDYKEVDSADFRGIDTIREMRRQMSLRPLSGPCRVWLLDECHKLSGDAQAALLKVLEDTPRHVYLMLATTDPQKLLKTITNRCTQFDMESLSKRRMMKLLKTIMKKEKKQILDEVLEQITKDSFGSPRAALVILDQIINLPIEKMMHAVKKAEIKESQIIDLCRALLKREKWPEITKILKGLRDQDPEQIRRAVLGYCSTVLLEGDNPNAFLIMDCFQAPTYDIGWAKIIMSCYEIIQG